MLTFSIFSKTFILPLPCSGNQCKGLRQFRRGNFRWENMGKLLRMPFAMTCMMAAVILLLAVSVSLAQLPTATILGVVKDGTGAVVPGAALTARNTDTGQSRGTVSGEDGSYRFAALPVGNYEIRAEHAGFRAEVRSGLMLTVAQEAVVNLTMQVGAIEQTVAVTAEAPLVNTTGASLGGLVNEDRIADLPLNGRNFVDLTLLQPGINQETNKSPGSSGIGLNFSSNGATIYSNSYWLDGTSTANFFAGTSASATGNTLALDGIREYRIVTSLFSAEYGMTMGSQMIVVSKSGTNAFHGSAFEFLRNSVLDARNFFDYTTPTTPGRLPAFKRNNFGASFGGPIKKDKTFFFATYEGLRERKGLTLIVSAIPAADKVDGGLVPQISPVIKPFLPYFPDPNLPNNQFTYPFSQPTRDDYGQIRVDETISGSDSAFARYTIDDGIVIQNSAWPAFARSRVSRNQYLTLSENHVFSATLLNTFRASYGRTTQEQNAITPGLIGPQFSFVPGQEAGIINVAGISSSWGPSTTTPTHPEQNIISEGVDLFYTRGRHALKFGVLINRYQQYTLASANSRGTVAFPNLTSFLLAEPSTESAVTPGAIQDRRYDYYTVGTYAQDDLRLSSRLTLNLGLRYEFNTTYHETHNRHAALRDVFHDPTTTIGIPFINPSLHNFSPRVGFAWDVTGDGKTSVRGGFGVLYDVLTFLGISLHSGVCAPPFCNSSSISIPVTNPPTTLTLPLSFPASAAGKSLRDLDYHLQQPHMDEWNLTVERQLPGDMALSVTYAGSRGLNLMQITEGNPTVPQILPDGRKFWTGTEPRINPNFGTMELHTASIDSKYNSLQVSLVKRLSKGLQFQSSYTFSKLIDTDPAQTGGETLASNEVTPDPANLQIQRAVADYDATHVWHFNAIYRIPDLVSKGNFLGKVLNGWSTSGILTLQSGLPFTVEEQTNRSRSNVFGGGSTAGAATSPDRPDLVPGRNNSNITSGTTAGCPGVAAGQKLGTPNLWYDPCAFTLQPAGFLGDAGRNILRGPGVANIDFSLTKDTPLPFLGESGKLQFRADIFNILNHANFTTPELGGSPGNSAGIVFAGRTNGELPLATAGNIPSTSTASRQIQLSLRIVF